MYFCGPPHIDKQRVDDQLEPINNSSMLIQDEGPNDLSGVMNNRDGW